MPDNLAYFRIAFIKPKRLLVVNGKLKVHQFGRNGSRKAYHLAAWPVVTSCLIGESFSQVPHSTKQPPVLRFKNCIA